MKRLNALKYKPMTPKEKAIELVGKMCLNDCTEKNINLVKQYALIAVNEIIKVVKVYNDTQAEYTYWQEVKLEIEKL